MSIENVKEHVQAVSLEPLLYLKTEEIICLSWGQEDSPVQPEPDMISDRLFVSILCGKVKGRCVIRVNRKVSFHSVENQGPT